MRPSFTALKLFYLHISQHDIRKIVKAFNIIDTLQTLYVI